MKLKLEFEDTALNTYAPLYSSQLLYEKYSRCTEKNILYIGKANGKCGLKQKIKQYMKYGFNEAINHRGGRAIWQIKNNDMLLIRWKCCDNCEEKEKQLLKEYKDKNTHYPLANWRI